MAVKKYEESEEVRKARQLAESMQKPDPYVSQYGAALDDAMDKVVNRKPFQYDMSSDPTYLQYRDSYQAGGQKAAADSMARAAAATGGYGNSYAQAVSQQAYGDYMTRLADKIPELRQLAMEAYDREGDNLARNLSILQDREAQDYGRYRDSVSDYERDRDYALERYDTERGFDYQKDRDSVADQRWEDEFGYQKDRDAVADQRWQSEFDESKRRYDQEWDYQMEKAGSRGGGGSGSGNGDSDNDDVNTEPTKEELIARYKEMVKNHVPYSQKGDSDEYISSDEYLKQLIAFGVLTEREATELRNERGNTSSTKTVS